MNIIKLMGRYFIALCAFFWIVSSSSGQEKIKTTLPFSKIGFDTSKPNLDSIGSVYKQFKQRIPDSSFIRGYSAKLDTSLVKKAVKSQLPDSTFVLDGNRFFETLNLEDSLELNLFDSAYFDRFRNELSRLDTLQRRNALKSLESDSAFVLKSSWYPAGPPLKNSLELDVVDSTSFDKIIDEVTELESHGLRELPDLMDSVLSPSSFKNEQVLPKLDRIPTGLGDKFGTVNKVQFSEYVDSDFGSKVLYADSAAVGTLISGDFPSQYFTDSVAFPVALDGLTDLDSLNLRTIVDGVLADSLTQIDRKLQEFLQSDGGPELPSEEYLRENFLSDTLLNKYLETFSIDKPEFADWDSDKITESIRSELPPVPEFDKEYQALSTRIVSLKDRDLVDSVRNLVSRKLYRIKDEVQDSLSVYLIAEKEKLKDNLFFEGLVSMEKYKDNVSISDFSGSLGVRLSKFYEMGLGPEIGVSGKDFSAVGARLFARRKILEDKLFVIVENSFSRYPNFSEAVTEAEGLYSNLKLGAGKLFNLSPNGETKLNIQTLLNPQSLQGGFDNVVDFRLGISKLSRRP